VTDLFGYEIRVGDDIVYATRIGNSAAMNAGTVTFVGEDYVKVMRNRCSRWAGRDENFGKRESRLAKGLRIVVLEVTL